MDTNKLQNLINQKAEAKLKKDIADLASFLSSYPLLNTVSGHNNLPQIYVRSTRPDDGNKQIPLKWVLSTDFTFKSDLFAYWLPIYIERETTDFMLQVQNISDQVSGLLNAEFEDNEN